MNRLPYMESTEKRKKVLRHKRTKDRGTTFIPGKAGSGIVNGIIRYFLLCGGIKSISLTPNHAQFLEILLQSYLPQQFLRQPFSRWVVFSVRPVPCTPLFPCICFSIGKNIFFVKPWILKYRRKKRTDNWKIPVKKVETCGGFWREILRIKALPIDFCLFSVYYCKVRCDK